MPPPQVLIVEDHSDTREMYRLALASAGMAAVEAGSALQALREARHRRPDLIVTDLRMPGIDGFELARQLKADEWTAAIPIVAVTSLTSVDSIARAQRVGVSRVLTKPCAPEDLVAAVRMLLDRSHRLRGRSADALRRAAELCARSAALSVRSARLQASEWTLPDLAANRTAAGPPELELRPRLDRRPELLCRIAGEFVKAPAMKLTMGQAARLWGLDPSTCQHLLNLLVRANIVNCSSDGRYRLQEGGTGRVRTFVAELLRAQRAKYAS